MALGEVFLQVVPFSLASIIPLMVHTRLRFNSNLIRRTSRQAWRLSTKDGLSDISGALNFKVRLSKAIYYKKSKNRTVALFSIHNCEHHFKRNL